MHISRLTFDINNPLQVDHLSLKDNTETLHPNIIIPLISGIHPLKYKPLKRHMSRFLSLLSDHLKHFCEGFKGNRVPADATDLRLIVLLLVDMGVWTCGFYGEDNLLLVIRVYGQWMPLKINLRIEKLNCQNTPSFILVQIYGRTENNFYLMAE